MQRHLPTSRTWWCRHCQNVRPPRRAFHCRQRRRWWCRSIWNFVIDQPHRPHPRDSGKACRSRRTHNWPIFHTYRAHCFLLHNLASQHRLSCCQLVRLFHCWLFLSCLKPLSKVELHVFVGHLYSSKASALKQVQRSKINRRWFVSFSGTTQNQNHTK